LNVHPFAKLSQPFTVEHPSIIVDLHPNTDQLSRILILAQRESIFFESRNHNGWFKAAGMYGMLFKLCAPGQMLSVQFKDEVS